MGSSPVQITSPGYQKEKIKYPELTHCLWKLELPSKNYQFQVMIHNMNLPKGGEGKKKDPFLRL